jgi:hypothetical protein
LTENYFTTGSARGERRICVPPLDILKNLLEREEVSVSDRRGLG